METFKDIVDRDFPNGYCSGLKALRNYSEKVVPSDNRKVEGSIDIDKYLAQKMPECNRWDYAIGYDGQVYFLEVHEAKDSEITIVVKKSDWMRLQTTEMQNRVHAYFWTASGKNTFSRSGRNRLAQNKITWLRQNDFGEITEGKLYYCDRLYLQNIKTKK